MSFTIVQDKDDSLKISATLRSTDDWDKFCRALANYRSKFEPKEKAK